MTRVITVEHSAPLRDGLSALIGSTLDIKLLCNAETPEEAFAQYVQFRPEALIVDMDIPGSLDFIRRVRIEDRTARIIPLVAYEWDENAKASFAVCGMEGLAKDQISDRLLALIRAAVKERRTEI